MVRTRRLNIRKTIFGGMFVVSLLIIMVFVSYSWFNTGEKATVTGITMNVAEGNNLVIRGADPDSKPEKTLQMFFPDTLVLEAVAGNGINFYEARVGYQGDKDEGSSQGQNSQIEVFEYIPIDISGADSKEIIAAYEKAGIFAFDFSFSIEKDTPVYIYGPNQIEGKNGSSVIPAVDTVYEQPDYEEDEVSGVNKPPSWKSPYGDFNVGNICAAVRIAILQKVEVKSEDGEVSSYYKPTFIWAPNSTIELYRDADGNLQMKNDFSYKKSGEGENVEYSLERDTTVGTVEEKYIFPNVVGEDGKISMIEVTTGGAASGTFEDEENGVIYAWGELTACKIGELTANKFSDFRIVVWVDGNDRECDNALLAGQITVDLEFGTIDTTKSEDNTDEVTN